MNTSIKRFFEERKAISLGAFEKEAGIPALMLYNFIHANAELKGKNLDKVVKTIEKYAPGILKKYQLEFLKEEKE